MPPDVQLRRTDSIEPPLSTGRKLQVGAERRMRWIQDLGPELTGPPLLAGD
jgi:hypothetical protein